MGYKIDKYYPILEVEIIFGEIKFKNIFGQTFLGSVDKSISIPKFKDSFVPYGLHMYHKDSQFLYTINKDKLMCIYLNSNNPKTKFNKELYVTYTVELPSELTIERNYDNIGYYIDNGAIYCVIMDKVTPSLIHIVDEQGMLFKDKGSILLAKPITGLFDLVETYTWARSRVTQTLKREFILRDAISGENIIPEVAHRW